MNHSRQFSRAVRGFTLLELLIAVSVFAIVLAAINAVFYSALRLRNKAAEALERSLPLERALTTIKRDLANLVPPGGLLAGALQTTATANALTGQTSPDFYTSTGMLDDFYPSADLQKVAYLLLDSTNGAYGKTLVRAVTHNLLASTQETPEQQWLLDGVQNLAFFYHDGMQWQNSWDSTAQTNLPLAIKVHLQLAPATGSATVQNQPVELVVPINVQARTNATQTGGTQ